MKIKNINHRDENYRQLELEANTFARFLLCPEEIIQAKGIDKPQEIKKYFGVSWTAARIINVVESRR